MNNNEMTANYGMSKKTKNMLFLQLGLIAAALAISLFGIFKSLALESSMHRIVVYGAQALICLASLAFGASCFKKKDAKNFRILVIAYALLEAMRVSLLQTGGIEEIYCVMAKFILVLLAVAAVLLSERIEKKEGLHLALIMTGLEILLYIVFIVGFPAVRTSLLFIVAPLVGILMAGSMSAFVAGRLEQISNS